jgi:hypothetical protein
MGLPELALQYLHKYTRNPLLATSFPEEGLNHVPEISDT